MVRWALIGVVLLFAACDRQDPDTILFAVATPPSVLDPRLAGDAASERVTALLYRGLVELDEQGLPHPGIATWQLVTPTHYRFTLRPERASFVDGRLPRAADVVATYRSVLDPALGSPHAGALAAIARIEADGDDAVDFHLQRPDPLLPSRLTIGIAPRTALDGGRQLSRSPIGSGAFAFVAWRDDGGLLLRRRHDGQQLAFVPVPDPTMRALKVIRGEAHLLQNDLPAELYSQLAHEDGVQLTQRRGTTFAYLGFNLGDPLLANHDIRAAIAHAIDRHAIVRYLFDDRAVLAGSVLRPQHWAGAKALDGFTYDPVRARELLQRAGFGPERPLTLSYKTSTDPLRLRIAHVFQSQLAAVGIELKIASYDWGTFFGDIKAGRFQLYSLAWVGVNTPDILRYAFHSESTPPGGANRGRYGSAVVDELIALAEQVDGVQAAGLYTAVQAQVHHDIVYVPLWYENNVAVSRGLRDYVPGHDGNYLALNNVRFVDAQP